MKNKRGFFLYFANNKLDPDGWLVADYIFNCTKKIEKQDAEKKNVQATIKLKIARLKKYCFFAMEKCFFLTRAF